MTSPRLTFKNTKKGLLATLSFMWLAPTEDDLYQSWLSVCQRAGLVSVGKPLSSVQPNLDPAEPDLCYVSGYVEELSANHIRTQK